ncbi:hypothetical protein [Algoriphagus zhangzhouensis]|uniref:PH domain-containing protein n=1 Tax=Algoriphagus zhangzhouensis TaxID=1073327 RepID=A0A1M7ZF79_9BACT|nr:hypothetical protein [Algoriphagus zhangzhouensis]TDY46080.1 hypothetical protein A8938_2687 [Algoriphagus zhangzhouensis]SHO63336.1 hypothetical protein SAMN04488108_2684 [Algoriphagus zhangzhouensis]
MKYLILLSSTFLYFIGALAISYYLWNIEDNWIWKGSMVLCPITTGLLFFWIIQSYSKVHHNNTILRITKLFSTKSYDLKGLTSWNEDNNIIRISFRKLNLQFNEDNVTIIDFADRDNVEQLYHYLKTHFPDKNKKSLEQ